MIKQSREIAFPFRIGAHGGVAFVEESPRAYFQRIVVATLTQPGERIMLPSFGTPVGGFLFESLSPNVAAEISIRVKTALAEWVPSVDVVDVTVDQRAIAEGRLLLDITYTVPLRQETLTATVDVGGAINPGDARG